MNYSNGQGTLPRNDQNQNLVNLSEKASLSSFLELLKKE